MQKTVWRLCRPMPISRTDLAVWQCSMWYSDNQTFRRNPVTFAAFANGAVPDPAAMISICWRVPAQYRSVFAYCGVIGVMRLWSRYGLLLGSRLSSRIGIKRDIFGLGLETAAIAARQADTVEAASCV